MVNDWAAGRVGRCGSRLMPSSFPNMPKVRPLAIVDSQRSARMPDIPTVAETLPNFRGFPAWWAFFGPAGLPAPIAERLERRSARRAQAAEVVAKLGDLGTHQPSAARPKSLRPTSSAEIDAGPGVWPKGANRGLEPE